MNSRLYNRHLISINDLTIEDINQIIDLAEQLKKQPTPQLLNSKLIASCFFEPSTRTRLSFEAAIHRLGGQVIGFSDTKNISTNKGESLADTINIISSYVDAIVMRHPENGSVKQAQKHSSVPIINGGDGSNQHPTQTLLDLFSIKECQHRLNNLNIAFMGDLKYGRTVHSLALAMKHFNNHLTFIAQPELMIPPQLLKELDQLNIQYQFATQLESVIESLDIIYMTRIQTERLNNEKINFDTYNQLNIDHLNKAQKHLKILHPLPRVKEISVNLDDTPFAYYFEQAKNGVYIRQALLALILNKVINN